MVLTLAGTIRSDGLTQAAILEKINKYITIICSDRTVAVMDKFDPHRLSHDGYQPCSLYLLDP